MRSSKANCLWLFCFVWLTQNPRLTRTVKIKYPPSPTVLYGLCVVGCDQEEARTRTGLTRNLPIPHLVFFRCWLDRRLLQTRIWLDERYKEHPELLNIIGMKYEVRLKIQFRNVIHQLLMANKCQDCFLPITLTTNKERQV